MKKRDKRAIVLTDAMTWTIIIIVSLIIAFGIIMLLKDRGFSAAKYLKDIFWNRT